MALNTRRTRWKNPEPRCTVYTLDFRKEILWSVPFNPNSLSSSDMARSVRIIGTSLSPTPTCPVRKMCDLGRYFTTVLPHHVTAVLDLNRNLWFMGLVVLLTTWQSDKDYIQKKSSKDWQKMYVLFSDALKKVPQICTQARFSSEKKAELLFFSWGRCNCDCGAEKGHIIIHCLFYLCDQIDAVKAKRQRQERPKR